MHFSTDITMHILLLAMYNGYEYRKGISQKM